MQTPIHINYCNSSSSTDLKKLPIKSEQTFVSEVLQNQHVVGQVQNRNLESDSCAVVHSASRETEIINNTFELFVHAKIDSVAFLHIGSYKNFILFVSPCTKHVVKN